MNLARRLSCIALQAALVAMSVVGSGYNCNSTTSALASASDMRDMPGMAMHGAEHESDGTQKQDCSLPWAPRACSLMISCLPNGIGVATSAVVSSPSLLRDKPFGFAKELRSVSRSPEPPPPRA